MIIIFCSVCAVAIRTVGEMAELQTLFLDTHWYPSDYPCPSVGCKGRGQYSGSLTPDILSRFEVHDLTPQEAYAALNGLGFPEERDCGSTAVELAFQQKVKKVSCRQVNKLNRTIIDYIEFEDGTRMFFGSSPLGPIVYRIAKPHSYAEANGA